MQTGTSPDDRTNFRSRLDARQKLTGIFVRTPSHDIIEVVAAHRGSRPFDAVLLDAEHGPFDVSSLNTSLAVACALDVPVLVRVPSLERIHIQRALDLGAVGVVVPHVTTAEEAERAVRYAHYGPLGRGYSGSTRAGAFGSRPMSDVLRMAAVMTTVIIQFEDRPVLDEIDEIVRVPGVNAAFLGPADLAVALGCTSVEAPIAQAAVEQILDACNTAQLPLAALATTPNEVDRWADRGVSLVFHGTDQARFTGMSW